MGHLFYVTSSFAHYFVAIAEFKLELQHGNAQIGGKICFDLCHIDLWPLALIFFMDFTFVNGNNWKFHDDTMTGTL